MTARAARLEEQDAARARAHPLTLFGFDALVAGAARPRPAGLAFRDDHDGAADAVTYADLYQRVSACLARLRELGLARGEKILICCPSGAQGFVVLTAALAAGLDPLLAPLPLPLSRPAIARAARHLAVAAIFAPARFCGLDFEVTLLEFAAQAPSVRVIGTLGGALDGAADFSAAALSAPRSPRQRLSDDWGADESARIGALNEVGDARFVSQGALIAAALDLARATRPGGESPILSLCAPSSPAALVAGPLAALLTGAPLHSLAPFSARRFLSTLDSLGPARLVAPASVLPDLARAGLLTNGALIGVAAINGAALPGDLEAACPILSLRERAGTVTIDASHAAAHSAPRAAAE